MDVKDYPSGPIWPEVIMSILVKDKIIYKSDPIKIAAPGVPIKVDLNNVTEFTISLDGVNKSLETMNYLMTDDEISKSKKTKTPVVTEWTDTDLADASVIFADGSKTRLDEMKFSETMVQAAQNLIPFRFTYNNKPSSEFLMNWESYSSTKILDANRIERTITYTDPDALLEVKCVSIEYKNYPIIEWTLYFKNNGKRNTPIIKDIKAIDLNLQRGPFTEYILHHSLGSSCRADDFHPMETTLTPNMKKHFVPVTGYSTDPDMSYFNVELPSGDGLILAIGWPGQWVADFERDNDKNLRISAGQEITNLKLHPGEQIRTPLIVMQFWKGSWIRSQNIWRHWMIDYNLPKINKKPVQPIMAASAFSALAYTNVDENNQKQFIDRYIDEKVKLNWWWIDFGWHEGTWTPAAKRFPNGLKPVTDYAQSKSMKTILWFAPEHSPLGGKNEWMLKAIGEEPLCRGQEISVLDLGNKDAWNWLVDLIDNRITENGIDCYRHDTSWGPLVNWKANDKADRQGITENHYVTGFLAFYDELLRRHPGLLIDNCCRGGRRNDIETMRRSVPLWRTDYISGMPETNQHTHTYGLSLWLPMHGIGIFDTNPYVFRSAMSPSTLLGYDMNNPNVDYKIMKKLVDEWWEISPDYYGDFYPLTAYSITGGWMAWQFNTPETGTGFIQAFRRSLEPDELIYTDSIYVKLNDLDKNSIYEIKNMDEPDKIRYYGVELMTNGIKISSAATPSAVLISYKKVK